MHQKLYTYNQLDVFVGKKCAQKFWTKMQVLCLVECQLCLPDIAKKLLPQH